MSVLTPETYPLIILPAQCQLAYLKNRKPGLSAPQRLYTKEGLMRGLFFDYGEEALIAIMRRQKCSLTWAKTLIEEMYFLPESVSASPRLEMLQKLFQTLKKDGLLRNDSSFRKQFSGKSAWVIGYHSHDPELSTIAESLGLTLHYEQSSASSHRTVTKFGSIREEVHHVYNQISHLIDEGTPLNQISIMSPDPSYDFELRLAAPYFHLPINFTDRNCHFDTPLGRHAYELFESEGATRDVAPDVMSRFELDERHPVIEALNEVTAIPGNHQERVQFLKESLLKGKIDTIRYQDAINQIDTPYPIDSHHVFVLGAGQGFAPRVVTPHGFLSASERAAIGRLTYDLENENEARQWEYLFREQSHLYLSFSSGNESGNYPSPLFKTLGYDVVEMDHDPVEYGGLRAQFHLAALLDQKRIYHQESALIGPYQDRYHLPYRDYDYRYRHFDVGLGDVPMVLAYTGIKTFYQCRFRYYLDYILRLDPREDTFFIRLGNMTHGLLESMY
ncbi:MAG: PD-(D/E)XK nuclease family protein, partial [Bacilli bacterium]